MAPLLVGRATAPVPVRRERRSKGGTWMAKVHVKVGLGVALLGGEGEGGGAPHGADGQELGQGGLDVIKLGLVHLEG